jgi:hypothetical protein
MTFKTGPRIRETSTTTGTGTYTLAGPATGYQSFSVLGANNTCPYFATDGTSWEEGIGTVLTGPNRLERTVILASSNAGAAVNWAAGTRTLRCGPSGTLGIPRTLSKSVAGTGTTVLTQDEQRRDVLEFTGVLTGNRTIEVDASPWVWVVYNNTSGAFTLTLKVTGQTGVVIQQGARVSVYCDGTDIRSVDLNINALTEDTNPDGEADYLASYDASAGALKKILLHRATKFKVGNFQRDVSLAGSNQAVTGLGFKPKAVILLANIAATARASIGFTHDPSVANSIYNNHGQTADTWNTDTGNLVHLKQSGTDFATAFLASLDSDGFTVTWTKTGSPTGTATVSYLAFR